MADIPLFPIDSHVTRRTPKRPRSVPMTEQTLGGIPPRVAERLANTETHSTPRRGDIDTESDHHSGSATKATNDGRNLKTFEQWAKYHMAFDSSEDGTIEQFLKEYVPSNVSPLPVSTRLAKALPLFARKVPNEGKEDLTYRPLLSDYTIRWKPDEFS
ncbi:hypothetical protein BDQ17DRAFT_1428787 [Cyathus striatus]|nr:hypothetical protein BDQ17DRAFT_1428787 [Cyathus striatus]